MINFEFSSLKPKPLLLTVAVLLQATAPSTKPTLSTEELLWTHLRHTQLVPVLGAPPHRRQSLEESVAALSHLRAVPRRVFAFGRSRSDHCLLFWI
jgi:hypothetical protein